jgi:hypothetical protein
MINLAESSKLIKPTLAANEKAKEVAVQKVNKLSLA